MNAPCVLFIDEIEAISQRRETASKNMEHRIVTQLLSCFDGIFYFLFFLNIAH
jgi:ribosome biogenesis ATPase